MSIKIQCSQIGLAQNSYVENDINFDEKSTNALKNENTACKLKKYTYRKQVFQFKIQSDETSPDLVLIKFIPSVFLRCVGVHIR